MENYSCMNGRYGNALHKTSSPYGSMKGLFVLHYVHYISSELNVLNVPVVSLMCVYVQWYI